MSRIVATIVGFGIVVGLAVGACVAVVNDEDSLGRLQLVSHDYECADHDGCGEGNRRDKKTCFFGCDNIIIVPGLPGQDEPPRERAALVPPTPDKIIGGIQTMADAGINLGSTIARLVVDYVITVFRFLV